MKEENDYLDEVHGKNTQTGKFADWWMHFAREGDDITFTGG